MPVSKAPPDGGNSGEPAPPATGAALMRWRNWRLPVKLAAITAVPVVLAIALGVLTVRTQVQRAAAYERSDRLVALGEEVLTLAAGLQAEREASAGQLATRKAADPVALRPEHEAVDAGVTVVGKARAEISGPSGALTARLAEADRQLQRLQPLRRQVTGGGLDAAAAVDAYGEVVDGLLALHRVLASDLATAELVRAATALHDLAEITDQLSRQRSLVAVAAQRRAMPAAELAALRASDLRLADRIDTFAAAAGPAQLDDYRQTVAGPGVETRDQWVRRLLADPAAAPPSPSEWDAVSGAAIGLTAQVARRMQAPLLASSAGLQARASNRASTACVVLLAAFLLAAAVGVVITRQLLGSLGALRRTALDVADRGLPAAVAAIRDGDLPVATPRPVPVRTTEELGQLARAFDAVHRQALRLAADEAALRSGYSSVFVNLSRRSQSLVQRQLQLLERLERDEEDADQLDMLFRLDHLATRMRRNNENLMVLSGSDVMRRTAEPTPLPDLLRAAVSEIEHYQRVELRPTPQLQVAGHAAGDLVRLVAELLDNATAFSPPDNPVSLAAHRCDSGAVVVNVLDQGIGMTDEEIAAANAQLRGNGPVGLPQSRRMGLFVVARLAGRHGFEVRLHGGRDLRGVQATVTVPPELVIVPALVEPGPAGTPMTGTPMTGAPMTGAPMTGAPMAGAPMTGGPMAGGQEAGGRGVALAGGSGPAAASPVPGSGRVAAAAVARSAGGGTAAGAVAGSAGGAGLFWDDAPCSRPSAAGGAEPPENVAPVQPPAPQAGESPAAPRPAAGDLPQRTEGGNGRPRQGARSVGGYPRLGDRPRWWDTAGWPGGPPRPPRRSDVSTPIFDQMASVWFAASNDPQAAGVQAAGVQAVGVQAVGVPAATDEPNADAADAGCPAPVGPDAAGSGTGDAPVGAEQPGRGDAAGQAGEPGPASVPAAPAQPVQGSGTVPEPAAVPKQRDCERRDDSERREDSERRDDPKRRDDPEQLQSAEQRGAASAAEEGDNAGQPGPADQVRSADLAEPAGPPSAADQPGVARQPEKAEQPEEAEQPVAAGTRDMLWYSAADEGWQAVRALSAVTPSEFTPAGLPRRTPRQSLLPGSVAVAPVRNGNGNPPAVILRDAADVRSRLSSLHDGLSRGRHGLDLPAAETPPGEGALGARAPGERAPSEGTPGERAPSERALGEGAPSEQALGEGAPGESMAQHGVPAEHEGSAP